MIIKILGDMVYEAAKEINFEFDETCVDMVLESLHVQYDIELNDDGPITWQLMDILATLVKEWQADTKMNFC